MVWRLYVLYPRPRWISASPIILLIADVVSAYKALHQISVLPGTVSDFVSSVTDWLIITWSISLSVQITTTSLISWKIWRSLSQVSSLTGGRPHPTIIKIIVESGLIYTLATLTWLVLFVLKMQAEEVLNYPIGQISALVPSLIIVRAGLDLHYSPSKLHDSNFDQPHRSGQDNQVPIEISIRHEIDVERATAEYSLTDLASERKSEFALRDSDSHI